MRVEQLAELIHETHQNLAPSVVEGWEPQPWETINPDARLLLTETCRYVKHALACDNAFALTEMLLALRTDPEAWHEFITTFNDQDESTLRQLIFNTLIEGDG